MIILFMILYSLLAGYFNKSADVTTPAPLHKHKNVTNLRHHNSHILHPKFKHRHHNSGRKYIYNVTGRKLNQHQQKKHHRSHRNKRIPDIPIQSNYVAKQIEACPDTGYFFKQDGGNGLLGSCYLCFCKDNSSAICWPRDNKHCDNEHYEHLAVLKKEQRRRRSPLSFSDIFMRDATKDAIVGRGAEQCKPHEASRSEGCPPDDWCVGCTVCDCSVNGMWNCHLLSFCTEDDKKKKKAQKLLASVRRPDDPYGKQKPKLSSARRREAKEAVQKLAENMAQARQKKKTGKAMAQRRHFFFKNGTLKNSTLFDMRKIVKSKYLNEFNSSQVGEVLALNLKVRKMSDNVTKKKIEAEQENGRKVAQVLNFQARGMKDKKARRKIKRRHSDAVNVLAKRQPVRKKKQKLIVPPGFKLPSDMKNNFVLQTEPSRPATKNLPNKQRNNHASNKRPVRRASNNQNKRQVKQNFENRMSTKKVPGGTKPNMMKRSNEVKNGKRKIIISKRQTPGTTTSKSISRSIKKPQRRFINSKDSSKTGNGVKEKRGTSKNKTKDKSAYELLLSNLKDTSSNNKPTKSSKAVSKPEVNKKTNHPKVDSKKLNENLMQIQKQMQIQLNSKLLKAVEEMMGETLTEAPAKKVKRAAELILDNIYTNNNQTMVHYKPAGIDIPMVKISVETTGNSTKPLETRVPRQIDFSKLQKQMQENLNRRLIQEVEKMIDSPLTEASINRQKRFAQLMKKVVKKSVDGKYNETKTLSIPFIKKKHALGASKHVSRRHIALSNLQGYIRSINRKSNKKQWTSPVGTRIKRFALDNNNTETESPIPVLIKPNIEINVETTAPAPIQVGIRQDPARLKRQNIPFSRRNSLQEAAKELLILPTNQVKFNTVKRSASLYKKVVMKKIVSEDRNKSKLVEIPIKKSQKTNVDKSNKIKLRRYKRDSNEELQYDRASLEDFEKSNTMDIIEASSKPMQSLVSTTESSINYYKYSIDEFDKTTPPSGDYVSEIIEVYSKNVAAKRSVDNQINGLTDLTVLKLATNNDGKTSTVKSLENVNNDSYTTEINLTKIVAKNNISVVQNAQPEIVEMKTYRTERVLDNQVVIIQEQNMSSVENMTEAFGNSYGSDFVSHPDTLNTMTIKDLINRTVVSIEEQNHNKIDNVTEIKDISVKKRITGNKFSSDEFIDRTVVIITDQSTESATTQPNEQSLMDLTTERISKLKLIDSISTTINPSKEPSSVSLPKNIIIQSYENVGKNIAILTEKSVELKQTKEDDKTTRNETISKNKFTTVGKQATEYKLKTDFNFENVTQNATLVIPLNISNKVTLTPTVKNYLKYRVDKKAFTEKQGLLKRIKQKQAKRKKLQNQAYMLQTTTERTDKTIKPKHKIDEHIVFVLQKDIDKKVRENVSAVYNNSFSNAIDTNEIKSNGWDDKTMLTVVEQNFTSASYQNIDKSTEKSPVFEYKVKKNVSRLTLPKNKVATYDITKVNLSKKHKLKKVVVTLHNKTRKSESLHSNNVVITQPGHKNGTNDLKSFFKKLLEGFNIKKGNRKGNKARKFKILKYLQKFFKKIFAGDSKHKKNSADDPQLNKKNIIETLCATFGPCNINVKNKAKLQSQINHLNVETYKMLRSVKIIKGLLKLVDFARNDKQIDVVRETTTKTNFKNDVQKLHAILKDTYLDEEQLKKLTDTQKIQLAYIKNNTQDFIQSAGKFTMVLNEIINIITVPDHKSTEVNQKTVLANQEKNENKRQSKLNDSKTVKNKTDTTQSLQKLRELLARYNMIQNTFMRKIYRAITNIDKGSTENVNKINNTDKVPKESRIIKSNVHNKTEAIQVYTKNIIQNLRKLKNLAQTLNGGSARRKRDLRDNDSIEYLLMLMEYLLKQNHPLDAAPVNDGIDLLIEAIKNAPDIKPIKKKVLQFHARNFTKSSTMGSSEAISSKEDSASDIDVKVSKEANYTNIEDTKYNAIMDHSIEDDEDDDRFAFKRAKTITTEEPKKVFYSKRLDAHDLTTTTPFTPEPSTYSYASSEIITIESTAGTFNSKEIGNGIKFDIYNAEIEEDVAVTDTEKPTTESELTTFTATLETTTKTQEKPKLVKSNKNEDVSMSKSRLDWLDESYEEEIKRETNMSASTMKPEKGPSMVTKAPKISNDVSGFSKENLEQGLVKKTGTEEVMYKKDMNLLNSLDYGNEKIKTEASESKESESNDKYSGDAFSSYFN